MKITMIQRYERKIIEKNMIQKVVSLNEVTFEMFKERISDKLLINLLNETNDGPIDIICKASIKIKPKVR